MTRLVHHLSPRARAIVTAGLRRRDGDTCPYCGVTMTFNAGTEWVPSKASIEHIVPIDRGGDDTWGNLTLCCMRCNVSKQSKTAAEFVAYLAAQAVPA